VGKGLDPDFSFMEVAKPYAMELMSDMNGSEGNSIINELSRQAVQVSTSAFGLPRRLEDTLEKLERGDVRVRVRSIETERLLRRQTNILLGGIYALIISGFTLSATILLVQNYVWFAVFAGLIAATVSWLLIRLLLRLDRYDRMY
ncbi:MAG: AarF/ABC1/UbiB kinase family protein, partial [Cyanobacteria bacterium J06629_18]